MTARSTGLACLLALTLWSCGTEDTAEVALHGSVSRIYPLQYDSVRARLFTSELAIQYVSGREVIISAVARLDDMPVEGPTTIDLGQHGEVVGNRGNVILPPFLSGTLVLDAYAPREGSAVTGYFDAVIDGDDRNYAVHGDFDVLLEDRR